MKSIDYSTWKNVTFKSYAMQADKDGVKGLSGQEIFDFTKLALNNNADRAEISELLGAQFSRSVSGIVWKQNPEFGKASEYYNNNMNDSERSDVTSKTYSNLETRLYNMEKAIDQAFVDCETYQDIVIVPKRYYRFYPNFNDQLINFNLEEIRNLTSKDMEALHELRDKVEYILEDANGLDEHNEPDKKEYDVDKLAQKHLGMSYEEFVSKYAAELEFCKTVTAADFGSMSDTQRMVYAKAKAYASDMLNTTILEAHTTNWDVGERKTDETLKATDDMFTISEFETDGITDEGLSKIKSGIMYKAFEESLIDTYHELSPSGIEDVKQDNQPKKPKKVLVNGAVLIFMPDGSIYDTSGKKIK